jgi:hypothetical protein
MGVDSRRGRAFHVGAPVFRCEDAFLCVLDDGFHYPLLGICKGLEGESRSYLDYGAVSLDGCGGICEDVAGKWRYLGDSL